MIVQQLEYFISLSTLFISILLIFIKYGLRENLFSPLNLLVIVQLLTVFFQIPVFFSKEFYLSLQASYLRCFLYDLDFLYLSLNALGYATFNLFLLTSLILIKYKPIKSISFSLVNLTKFELFLALTLIFGYTMFNLANINFQFTPLKILELRYNLEHGFDVLLTKLVNLFLVGLLTSQILMRKNIKKIKSVYKIIFVLLVVVFIVWGIAIGTRGFLIFSLLFFSFIATNELTGQYFLKKLRYGYINKRTGLLVIAICVVLVFYYIYSIRIRGYSGNILSVISQRFDYFIASYVALKKVGINFCLNNIFYPLISYIPRNIWNEKPFPVSSQITYLIWGYSYKGKWSVEFGIVGESAYVFPFIWLFVGAAFTGICLKWFSEIFHKKGLNLNIYDLGILILLYAYPMGTVLAGVLRPATGDIIYLGGLLTILSYLKRRKIKL